MPARPSLSLCIPTYNRAAYLGDALESGLAETASQPRGTVEILVCDNASTDETPQVIARIKAAHPELRTYRNDENIGFDRNYLRCMEKARGKYVWFIGDDDVWSPGSIARVLCEIEAGADACLCLAEACDSDLKPFIVLPWYMDQDPPKIWCLDNRTDLIRYFNACARNAGAFAFISVAIFRRDRFLAKQESLGQVKMDMGYVHLWGMMEFLRRPSRLHYIPEPLVRNRMSDALDDSYWAKNLFGRWMHDLRGWAQVADTVFGDDPELHDAFSRIVGRNHHDTILPGLRRHAPDEAAWQDAKPYLIRAGFSEVRIAAVDLAFQYMDKDRRPMESLDPASLCLVDLPILARGAGRIAVLALGGLQNVLEGAGLLATLRHRPGTPRIRVFCTPECAELLDGFEVQGVDPERYARDEVYREPLAQGIIDFAPELVVNLDPERGLQADDLAAAALPAGGLAFSLPDRGQDAKQIKAVNSAYTRLLPGDAGAAGLLEALGLEACPPSLWPTQAAREEAKGVLDRLGWMPSKTLAVLVDHPSVVEDPLFQSTVAEAAGSGWNAVGMGGRGTYSLLDRLLDPLGDRAVNLAGILNLGSTVAMLQLCGDFVGGTSFLGSVAKACGCPRIGLRG
jgi:abequosyltransferase